MKADDIKGLEIRVSDQCGVTVIDLQRRESECWQAFADVFDAVRDLVAQGERHFLLDLTNVVFDHVGMHRLISTLITITSKKGAVRLVQPEQKIRELLEVLKIESFADKEEALRSFPRLPPGLAAQQEVAVLEARVHPDGWTKCPGCGTSFATYSARSWDGTKHLGCMTKLRLTTIRGGVTSFKNPHSFVNGICRRCGRSKIASEAFGWGCD